MVYRCSINRLSSKQRTVTSLCSGFIIVHGPPVCSVTAAGFGPLFFGRSLCFLTLNAAADTFTAALSCSAALELLTATVKVAGRNGDVSGYGFQNKTPASLLFIFYTKIGVFMINIFRNFDVLLIFKNIYIFNFF